MTVDTQLSALNGTPALATTATSSSSVAGSPYPIIVSVGTITNPFNYQLSFVNGGLSVNPAALTITADNASKTYGQTINFAGTEFTSLGLQNAETIGSVTLTSLGAVSSANVAGSPYLITPSNAVGGSFNTGNYSITYKAGVLTINPEILTAGLTGAATKIYDGTTAATLSAGNYTLTGIVNGDAVSLNDPANGSCWSQDWARCVSRAIGGFQIIS
jgi:hypothetical protein